MTPIEHDARLLAAARTLIGLVMSGERQEGRRSEGAELTLEVDLTGGGRESWTITIERTAANH